MDELSVLSEQICRRIEAALLDRIVAVPWLESEQAEIRRIIEHEIVPMRRVVEAARRVKLLSVKGFGGQYHVDGHAMQELIAAVDAMEEGSP